MKINTVFHQEALKFLYALLNQRRYLNQQKLGKKDHFQMVNNVRFLELHLEANQYKTDREMAGFLIRHKNRIRSIIPGQPSKANIPQTETFEKLLARARRIVMMVKPYQKKIFTYD